MPEAIRSGFLFRSIAAIAASLVEAQK